MASSRTPAPTGSNAYAVDLNDGTSCRAISPAPGTVGLSDIALTHLDKRQKLIDAAQRSIPLLPAEARREFAALFSGRNLAVTATVLTAWGASHLVGAGEVFDVGLVIAGGAVLGSQATQVGHDLAVFIRLAVNAKSTVDLDAAAQHLSRVVLAISMTGFALLIAKYAGNLRGAAVAGAESEVGFYTLFPRGAGAASGPLPNGYVLVSRWVSADEARLWLEEGATHIPVTIGTETSRVFFTEFGAPNPTNNPIRIDFAVLRTAFEENTAGRSDWGVIFQNAANMPIHNVSIHIPDSIPLRKVLPKAAGE